jgi:hypothetical protein
MSVKIQTLIDDAIQKGVSAWIEYPNIQGFHILVGYIGKEEILRINETTKKVHWVKHRKEETTDRVKMTKAWAKKGILDWKGLTLGLLKTLIPIKVSPEEENLSVPCDEDNKFSLLYHSTEFDVWLTEAATNAENFVDEQKKREVKLEEVKN